MLFVIATLVEQKYKKNNTIGLETVGYKILNTSTGECKLLSEKTIKSSNLDIANVTFVNDKLVGSMGDLKRYTKLNITDGRPICGRSFVILGKNDEGMYLCVFYPDAENGDDLIAHVTESELKRQIKFSNGTKEDIRVANARIDSPNDLKNMKIRPIKGEFQTIEKSPKFIEKDFNLKKKQETHSPAWKVRIVKTGERYGVNYKLINDKETLVEFYDLNANKESFPIGQFVSRYYLNTILESKDGLCLQGDVSAWVLTKESMFEIRNWLESLSLK